MTSTIQIAKYGTIDDLLFRGKNKSYGAYQLRQEYEHRLRRAFFLFMASLTSIAIIVPAYNALMGNFIIVEDGSNPIGPVHNPSEFTEFEIEKPKVELPKAAQDVKSTMDVPPVIVDNPPKQDLKTRDDIIKDDGIISNTDNDGTDVITPSADPVVVGQVISTGSSDPVFDPSIIYEFAEVEPQFPGDLSKFLGDRAKFPEFESSQGIEKGYVLVGFVVNEDGSISDIKLLKADRENFNNQALKAVRAMPKWKPGSNDGHKVKVRLEIPFNFVDQ
jgi:protein TonB